MEALEEDVLSFRIFWFLNILFMKYIQEVWIDIWLQFYTLKRPYPNQKLFKKYKHQKNSRLKGTLTQDFWPPFFFIDQL